MRKKTNHWPDENPQFAAGTEPVLGRLRLPISILDGRTEFDHDSFIHLVLPGQVGTLTSQTLQILLFDKPSEPACLARPSIHNPTAMSVDQTMRDSSREGSRPRRHKLVALLNPVFLGGTALNASLRCNGTTGSAKLISQRQPRSPPDFGGQHMLNLSLTTFSLSFVLHSPWL
jgi:hypothetical protein